MAEGSDGSGGTVLPLTPPTPNPTVLQQDVGVDVAGAPGTGSGGDDALNLTGDTQRDAWYWAQNNPQATDQAFGKGVYWSAPDGSNSPAPSPLGTATPNVMIYQIRQFDSADLPTVGTWSDHSGLDVLQEPTGNAEGTQTLNNAKAALTASRNAAIALGPANALRPSTPNMTVQQIRNPLQETNRWTGQDSGFSALAPSTVSPSYTTSAAAQVAFAQATGVAGAPIGVGALPAGATALTTDQKTAQVAAVAASPVLARMNKAYDPVRYFYDRASNGNTSGIGTISSRPGTQTS